MLYNYKNIDEKMIVVNEQELGKCRNGEIFTVGVFKKRKQVKPKLEELVEKLIADVAILVVEVANINKRLDQNGLAILDINKRIDKIDARLDQNGLAILDINKRIDKIDARLDQNGLAILDINKRIDKIDARLDQNGLAILDINKRIDKIDARLDQNGLKQLVIPNQ